MSRSPTPVSDGPVNGRISALLQEDRRFPPSEAWKRRHHHRPRIYERAPADPEASGRPSRASSNGSSRGQPVLEWTPPHAKWFVGGKLNASVELPRPARRGPRRNKAAIVWEGGAGRSPDADLLGPLSPGQRLRQRAQVARRRARRPRRSLPAARPRARHRDARVRPHRRGPQRGLRRLQRRVAARSHQRRARRRSSSPPTAGIAAATSSR